MATKSEKPDETISTKTVETGNNKMASLTIKATVHELKIMEVEGAKDQGSMDTIELDDEDHNDNAPLETGNDTSDRQHDDEALQEDEDENIVEDERMSTKSEPSSGGESNASYNHDPMDLLERIETNHEESGDDEEDELTSGDEGSGSGSSGNIKRTTNPAERWQAWMKRWPWLLHEETDGDCAFCLYCNVVINTNRRVRIILQHNLSLYHQERETNYMAFKNSVLQKVRKDHAVKHEFGTNEYVAMIKQQRTSEVDSFNNFNWERWLKSHSWLKRTQPTGTIGLCKVCNVRMNIEFVYLRRRHETSKGHCEAKRQTEKQLRKRKRSVSPEEKLEESASKKSADDLDGASDTADPGLWFERLPDTNPPQCRCTLCDIRMAISSFLRHSRTNVHCSNLSSHQQKQLLTMQRGVWSQYAEQHPWLVADPDDPTLAFCSVCSKRFNYGHSEIKRKTHENSERHKALSEAAATTAPDEEKEEDEDEEEEEAMEEEEAEEEQSEVEEQTETPSNEEGSDEEDNSEEYKVTKRQKNKKSKQTVVRHYAWLRYSRDRKRQMCKYCRVRFHNEASKQRHEMSAHHKKMAKLYKTRRGATLQQSKHKDLEEEEDEEELQTVPKPVLEEPIPATVQGRVMVWKNRFPWLSYKRSEERLNYAWCKLCEVSIYMPSSKYASKHQRSSRHVSRHFNRKRGIIQAGKEETSLLTGEAKQKAAMSELQAKYSWLEPDASDENYCHCKICDSRLPIKVFYLRQHDGSRRHNEQVERLRNASEATTIVVADPQATPSSVVQVEHDGDSDEALSVKSECSTEELLHAKRSRREVRRILKEALRDSVGGSRRHEERSQLDMAKDMICSSFDIVQRLRNLERESGAHEYTAMPVQQQHQVHTTLPPAPPPVPQPRDTIELFFESITQTMKALPVDLVAEGKAKIMQIVCNLELRGMQRTQAGTQEVSPVKETPITPRQAEPERLTIDEPMDATPESPESRSSSVVFDDEQPVQLNNSHDNSDLSPRKLPTPTTITTSTAMQNGIAKEVPINLNRLLPNSSSSNTEAGEQLRLVPINKLTSSNPSMRLSPNQNLNNNIRYSGINQPLRKNQQQQQTPVKMCTANGLVKAQANGSAAENATVVIRKVHLSNRDTGISKVITYQQQTQRQLQQQQGQQQKLPLRYMSVSAETSTPTQAMYTQTKCTEAPAQFRALNPSRTFVRTGQAVLLSNRSSSHT